MPLNTKRQKDKELTKRPGDQKKQRANQETTRPKNIFSWGGGSMTLTTKRPKYIRSQPKDQETKGHKELTKRPGDQQKQRANQETRRPKDIFSWGGSMALTTKSPKYIRSQPKDQETKRHKELTKRPGDQKTVFGEGGQHGTNDQETKRHKELTKRPGDQKTKRANQETRRPQDSFNNTVPAAEVVQDLVWGGPGFCSTSPHITKLKRRTITGMCLTFRAIPLIGTPTLLFGDLLQEKEANLEEKDPILERYSSIEHIFCKTYVQTASHLITCNNFT